MCFKGERKRIIGRDVSLVIIDFLCSITTLIFMVHPQVLVHSSNLCHSVDTQFWQAYDVSMEACSPNTHFLFSLLHTALLVLDPPSFTFSFLSSSILRHFSVCCRRASSWFTTLDQVEVSLAVILSCKLLKTV